MPNPDNILQVFKIMHGIDKVAPEALFIRVSEREDARTRLSADPMNIRMKPARLDIRKHSIALRIVEKCNRLDSETKNLKSIGAFKNALKDLRDR